MITFNEDLHGCINKQVSDGDIVLAPINDDEYNIAIAYQKWRDDNGLPHDTELALLLAQYNCAWCMRYELAQYLETLPIVVKVPLGDPVVEH